MQLQRFVRQLGPATRQLGRRQYAQHSSHAPKVTMDDLPTPKGNWQANFDQNQSKYNKHLLLGIVVITATLTFGQLNGFHNVYNSIPEKPAVIESYRD